MGHPLLSCKLQFFGDDGINSLHDLRDALFHQQNGHNIQEKEGRRAANQLIIGMVLEKSIIMLFAIL